MIKEISEVKEAVKAINENVREVVETAIIDELEGGSGIKLNAFLVAKNYENYKTEYKLGNTIADEEKELTLEEFLDYAVDGLVVYKDEDGEIKAKYDTNYSVTGVPLKEFISENTDLFNDYNEDLYNEIITICGE